MDERERIISNYVATHSKSQGVSAILTILFGPLGLFYSNWVGALILLGIAFVGAATIVVPLLCWIISIFVGAEGVTTHNKRVRAEAELRSSKD